MSTKSIETPDVGYTNDVASRVWPLVNVTHGDPLAPFAMAAGRQYVLDQWWVAAAPGAAIFTVSLAFNLLGDGLRDLMDPKLARKR